MIESVQAEAGAAAVPRIDITVGDIQVGHLCEKINVKQGVGLANSADFVIRHDNICSLGLDYSGLVVVAFEWAGVSYPQFTGLVEEVALVDSTVRLRCMGAAALRDMHIGGFTYSGLGIPELIWTITREAGYSEDKLDIDGINLLPHEDIEVFVPLRGLQVDDELRIGTTEIVPPSSVDWVSAPWPTGKPAQVGPPEEIVSAFLGHGAYARSRYSMNRLYDAEQAGIRDAEFAAAWFCTRLRFGAACLPSERLQTFTRANFIAKPEVVSLVAVRGLTTGRRWIRVTRMTPKIVEAALPRTQDGSLSLNLPDSVSLRDREAVLAFWRSLDVLNPLASVIALWDAIEFYVGGTTAPKLFSKANLETLENDAPSWLDENQKRRYIEILAALNNAPLFARLRVAIEADRVPVTKAEIDLLSRLRKVRNPAQHGQERRPPQAEDLRRAWSIVARLLVYRLANQNAEE